MAGLFRLTDFQSKVLLFQKEAQILTARQGTCPARRVLAGTRKTPEASCFGTIHWLVWASEILDAHGRGRSDSRTNFLGGPPLLRRRQNFSTVRPVGTKSSHYQLSYGATQDRFRPKKRREGGPLKHSCPSMISLVGGNPLRGPLASIG